MAIPENQLETWSHQGAVTSASQTYERIRNALLETSDLRKYGPDVFLQGSYRNHTNIRGDSDVDVVVMRTKFPHCDDDDFYRKIFYDPFRRDVLNVLRRVFYNQSITEGGKSIKIPRTSNYLPADVVPCIEYHFYPQVPRGIPLIQKGIWLWDSRSKQAIINFPKQHFDNGVAKNERTNQRYKPTVRIFKNARGWLLDHGRIQEDTASSYAIECLLYNVPDCAFCSDHSNTFVQIVNWLNTTDMTNFVCQNNIQKLFAAGGWTQQNARSYIRALIEMWNNWGR